MHLSKLQEWWWTGKPGVLQSMGSQRVGRDWATEQNWSDLKGIESSGGGLVAKSYLTLVTSWAVVPRILSLCYFPGMILGCCRHFLLQGIFLTQELNPSLLHCSQILYWSMREFLWFRTLHKYQNSKILRSLMKNDIVFAYNIYTLAVLPYTLNHL